nr:NADH dehydrogenase subunit 3 [Myrsidea ptilorhynchi]
MEESYHSTSSPMSKSHIMMLKLSSELKLLSLNSIGIKMTTSKSKISKTIVMVKKWMEKGTRGSKKGSNPHSKALSEVSLDSFSMNKTLKMNSAKATTATNKIIWTPV